MLVEGVVVGSERHLQYDLVRGRGNRHGFQPHFLDAEIANGKDIATSQGSGADAAEGVARSAAEHRRHGDATPHPDVGPHARAGRRQPELGTRRQVHGVVGATGDPVDEHADPRPGDRNDGGAVGPQDQPADEHLEAGRSRIVAAQALGERVRAEVGRAGPAHALRRQRRAPEILHEGQRPGSRICSSRHR